MLIFKRWVENVKPPGEDDLGLGDYADSTATGHAGARVACCLIE